MSLPPTPFMVSLPAPPQMTSSPEVPVRVSAFLVPGMVHAATLVSTVQVRLAGVASVLPAASVALTRNVWDPSARLE
jgi:hypothetical protein